MQSTTQNKLYGDPMLDIWNPISRNTSQQTPEKATGKAWVTKTTPHTRPIQA